MKMEALNMPINPKDVVWDETPQIDASNIVWDSPVVPQEPSTVERVLRGTALLGKQAYTGLTSIPAFAGEAIAAPYNLLAGGIESVTGIPQTRVSPSRAIKSAGNALYGDVQPQNMAERLQGDVVTSLGGAAGMMGAGKLLSGAKGTLGAAGTALTEAPMMQYAGAATSGLSSGLTREAGGGEGAQLGAGLVGGLLPYGVGLAYGASKGVIGDVKQGLAVRKGNTAGQVKEAERFIQENAAGDPRTIQALEKAKTYIPSQKPTTSEALAQYKKETGEHTGTALIKIQDNISKLAGVGEGLKDISSKRSQSYGKIIDKIAGNEASMKAAITARTNATKPLYEAADNMVVKVTPEIESAIKGMPAKVVESVKRTAAMDEAISKVTKIPEGSELIAAGEKTISGKYLNNMLKGLKDHIFDPSVTPSEQQAAKKLYNHLNTLLEGVNKPYKLANQRFAELSKPINRMEVGIVLREKLKNAADQDSYLNFMNAADDAAKTIKDATGFARFDKFDQVLNKSEINAIKAINKDMQRLAEVKSISSKTVMPSGKNLADQEAATLPPLLWRPATIANFILKASNKDASMEVNKQIANMLADPRRVAAIIKATPKDKLPEMLMNLRAFGMGGMEAATPMATDMTQGQQ